MSANTKIEWADHTFNPWIGCTKISPACDHCYAEADFAHRRKVVQWGAGQPRKRTAPSTWAQPLKWNREAERLGIRYRVFCASLADVFDNEVPQEWRDDLFMLIEQTPHLDWLMLTKRIGNVGNMLPVPFDFDRHYPNVWLGATICSQAEADRDVPKLLRVPAAKRFLSIEPLLGSVDLKLMQYEHSGEFAPDGREYVNTRRRSIHWVIVGGESGHGARPMHPDWARSLRDQCQAAGVPFLFKQHGEWLATEFCDDDMAMIPSRRTVYVRKDGSFHDGGAGVDFFGGNKETAWVGKKAAGRLLDGREWNEVPA